MNPRVVIIVLNWNGGRDTLACLESLKPVRRDDVEVLVVDNGSTDDSVATIRAAFPDLELIEVGRNLGYAGGNNVGIERAMALGAQFVLVLNNDTVCAPDVVDRLLEAAARHPRVGMFCPRIFYMDEPARVWFDEARWNSAKLCFSFPGKGVLASDRPAQERETDYASGAALFVRADVVGQVGSFDERFFLVWEEADWCYRARQHGWQSMVVPSARVWHRIGSSFGNESSPLRTYFSSRNRLVWLFRHGTFGERVRGLAVAARAAVPRWHLAKEPNVALWRRWVWAGQDWLRAAAGRGERLDYLAKRRALLDFALRRLGPPPDFISGLNRRWSARRASQMSMTAP